MLCVHVVGGGCNVTLLQILAPMGSVLDRALIRTVPGVKSAQARLVIRCALLGAPVPAHLGPSSSTLPTIEQCVTCIPDAGCRPFILTVANQLAHGVTGDLFIDAHDVPTLSKAGLNSAKLLMLNLIPEFSIENTLPRRAATFVRKKVSIFGVLTEDEKNELRDLSPEIFELLTVANVGNQGAKLELNAFLEGLCRLVEDSDVVTPPPWEEIPHTYNPPTRGIYTCALLHCCITYYFWIVTNACLFHACRRRSILYGFSHAGALYETI